MKRIYNHIPDKPDDRDFVFAPRISQNLVVQPEYSSLREKCSPVVDQGQLGSCTANAIVSGLLEYYMLASGKLLTPLSRLFLYYKERELEGTINSDAGAMIRDGMKVAQAIGCPPETDFPYDPTKFTVKPSDVAEADAGQFKIFSYHRVMTLDDLKAAIVDNQPVVFGFTVYESFESFDTSCGGMVPMPDTTKEKCLGGHAVLAVGYNDANQRVIVRNSWGSGWGDRGYCYMPYDMFENGMVTDMWSGKLNAPKISGLLTPDQSFQYYANEGVIDNPPVTWLGLDKNAAAGQLTPDQIKYMPDLIAKIATREILAREL